MHSSEINSIPEDRHSPEERKRSWQCQKVVKEWIDDPTLESYAMIPRLYVTLFRGEDVARKNVPPLAEILRNSASFHSETRHENLHPQSGDDVYLLTSKYTVELDNILRKSPKPAAQAIKDAAWAYYVFERIHPLPDGNGRIGRNIIKRVLKGAGVRDPIYHDERWYGHKRSLHLEALDKVQDTNNLAYLELYLLQSIQNTYDPRREQREYNEIQRLIEKAQADCKKYDPNKKLSDIWGGFKGIQVYNN